MRLDTAREYSQRLGTLSGAQLQAALDRFDLGELLGAEPAQIGLFGQNVFLTTTRGGYVLRGAPRPDWQFLKERFFTKALHERTDVPVPWPYLVDPSEDIFGWSYVVMPKMLGLQIGDPTVRSTLTAADRRRLAWAMGENLARMHKLTWPHYGEYDAETGAIRPIEGIFRDWVIARVRQWLDRCRAASEATTEADVAWVEEQIAKAHAALAVPTQPTLVHQDYKENNAAAERTAEGWRVTGVFDVGGAYFGDGEEDLARSVATYAREDAELARGFLAGYQANRALRPGFAERFPLYMVADRLVIWQYGQRNKVWFDSNVLFREWASAFTSLRLL
ncbi:MAG: hypothetical protein A2148_08655 [Chloroflexi bacterium RBG_16_68_14]|nr:MAG: hypothetical protein A2148_08655 [Chloroflexi bacterium RBG_16_68_14]